MVETVIFTDVTDVNIFTDVTAPTTVKCGKLLISKTTEVDNCIKSDHAMKPTWSAERVVQLLSVRTNIMPAFSLKLARGGAKTLEWKKTETENAVYFTLSLKTIVLKNRVVKLSKPFMHILQEQKYT